MFDRPHNYLDFLQAKGNIKYVWQDLCVLSEDDSISYHQQRVYTVFVGSTVLQATYTRPTRFSAFSVRQSSIAHPSLARQSHKEVLRKLLNETLDHLPKVGVQNV